MDETELDVLRDIRDLLTLLAEPQLAERDKARRDQLRKLAGRGGKNMKAVLVMDGTRSQAAIVKEVPIDAGQLSLLVKALREAQLLKDAANPTMVIPVSEAVFKDVS
jgi:hypothetical protein